MRASPPACLPTPRAHSVRCPSSHGRGKAGAHQPAATGYTDREGGERAGERADFGALAASQSWTTGQMADQRVELRRNPRSKAARRAPETDLEALQRNWAIACRLPICATRHARPSDSRPSSAGRVAKCAFTPCLYRPPSQVPGRLIGSPVTCSATGRAPGKCCAKCLLHPSLGRLPDQSRRLLDRTLAHSAWRYSGAHLGVAEAQHFR